LEEKENIVSKLICAQENSYDFLNQYKNMYEFLPKNQKQDFINTFQTYYNILQYSLSPSENLQFYNFLENINPKMDNLNLFKYLSSNDPIKNFTKIYDIYLDYLNEEKNEDKRKENLKIIKNYIDDMLKIYNINFKNYYFPPMEEFPIYVYNFYFYYFLKILKKFQKKRVKPLFIITKNNSTNNNNTSSNNNTFYNSNNNNEKDLGSYTEEQENYIHHLIGMFFIYVNKLFKKFDYKNINKD